MFGARSHQAVPVNDHSPVREEAAIVPPQLANRVLDHLGSALVRALERPRRPGACAAPETVHRGGLSPHQVRKAKDFLAGSFGATILSADVAAACGLSRSHFARGFRRATGFTPRRWLQRYRVDKAKEMLSSSGFAIAEIALRCGFTDQSHLTHVFKALEGSSPAAWRRQRAAMDMA
jgi:AraC-like DNA-binding protein